MIMSSLKQELESLLSEIEAQQRASAKVSTTRPQRLARARGVRAFAPYLLLSIAFGFSGYQLVYAQRDLASRTRELEEAKRKIEEYKQRLGEGDRFPSEGDGLEKDEKKLSEISKEMEDALSDATRFQTELSQSHRQRRLELDLILLAGLNTSYVQEWDANAPPPPPVPEERRPHHDVVQYVIGKRDGFPPDASRDDLLYLANEFREYFGTVRRLANKTQQRQVADSDKYRQLVGALKTAKANEKRVVTIVEDLVNLCKRISQK